MKIIDLTLPMYTGMPVYPGDPEVSIEKVLTIEQDTWEMRRIQINSHDCTHVNVPAHCVVGGKTLDEYPLEAFAGRARIFTDGMKMDISVGVVFRDRNIDRRLADWVVANRPHFVALSSEFEIDIDIEREFLENDIVLFERLANTTELPDEFMFYAMPLKITGGDGSPVRAFAVV